jgi:peptidoglycan hydrolase-like protein with peptidoglycan-binding domain
MRRFCNIRGTVAVAGIGFALAAPPALAVGRPAVAGLQVTLRHHRVYRGPIDGLLGAATTTAVKRFQLRRGLTPDGVAGPRTRRALGHFARNLLGSRPLARAMRGWDVGGLQFALAWHGFPSGPIDGGFGARTERALVKFEAWAGLTPDEVAGPATFRALRAPPPRCLIPLAWPLQAPVGSPFGPRGAGFHPGIDLPAPTGTPVAAAATGRVVFAGRDAGGYGKLVELEHVEGVVTMYAHLSAISVQVGQALALGARVGRVGSTGEATGPHLHFEVRVRGAAVDPLLALP